MTKLIQYGDPLASFLGFPPSPTRVVTEPCHLKPFGNEYMVWMSVFVREI